MCEHHLKMGPRSFPVPLEFGCGTWAGVCIRILSVCRTWRFWDSSPWCERLAHIAAIPPVDSRSVFLIMHRFCNAAGLCRENGFW